MEDRDPYILGTNERELRRLKIQHDLWRSEIIKGWKIAKFKRSDILLGLGSDPGYFTSARIFSTMVSLDD